MRVQEIIRDILAILDAAERPPYLVPQGEIVPDEDANHTMVPPLQQKLEILKKSAGIESIYDEETDELEDIKKLTGIKAVMQHEADDDEPLA